MILYLDTSALIKLYVEEEGTTEVKDACSRASVVATSCLAYVEARAALARASREGRIRERDRRRTLEELDRDWENFFVLEVTDALMQRAGALAEQQPLRAYDAMHLASALMLRERLGSKVLFLCFDERLSEAATAAGLAP